MGVEKLGMYFDRNWLRRSDIFDEASAILLV